MCASLGPELEHFDPDLLYLAHLSRTEEEDAPPSSSANTNDHHHHQQQRVFISPTTETEKNARRTRRKNMGSTTEPRPTSRPRQRIPDPFTPYHGSFVTLWVLQIIVAMAIMACVAEGVHLSLRWYGTPDTTTAMVRFPGSDKLLIELLDSKKLILQVPNGDSLCITYEEDEDDDEMNRPVM
ncbi:hypothetical protein ACEQ8H_003726 [Pleosporales sp. CAS-2024a]